ncbi:MAG: flagellar basal-body rod protein FlgF [Proteobacteria bacterium]|nr:flagellar basal-body rod protein FlgF [Pseudomonadota bacterium]NDC24393.1 flagellar basal-body rod protein FlgF [Pseudomonadota bacterium]NDD05381.1 flagellar basal-body rod protein FlgF [Pseudomonadota bacterium]NDG27940.1 flagellar basal-body rod protein FlgF [Pseudomonadota bacterium]
MDKGIYTALSGGLAKAREVELIANNLANATTPGFKRDTGTFNEYLTELRRYDSVDGVEREIRSLSDPDARPSGDKSFVEMDGVYTDFKQGSLQKSGRSLDVAIEGTGFFEVLTPAGIRYTRQGNFSVDKEGRLVSASGFPVLAKASQAQAAVSNLEIKGAPPVNGSIPDRQPDGAQRVIQLGQGPVQITEEGVILQNGAQVATLSVEEFNEPQWLEKMGNSLYRNTHPANLKNGLSSSKLHQGFIEGSNVNPVSEMTRLIEATRAYESHMQAVKTYQDIDSKSVNDIVKER